MLVLAVGVGATPTLVAVEIHGGELPELARITLGEVYDEEAARRVDALLEEAAAQLAAEGYLGAVVLVSERREAGGLVLEIEVRRGERTALGRLAVNGARLLDPLAVEVAARTGWRRDGPRGLVEAVNALLLDEGLLGGELRLGGLTLNADGTCSLVLEIIEGEPVLVERLIVVGARGPGDEETARRVSGLVPGLPLNPHSLVSARRRLLRSGYYQRAEVDYDGDAVVLTVETRPALRLDGALGLLPRREGGVALFGQAEALWSRIGGPRDLRLLYRRGTEEDADYEIGYRERYLPGGGALLVDFVGIRRLRWRSDTLEVGYEKPLGETLSFSGALRGSLDDETERGGSTYLGLAAGLRLDTRDEPLNVTRGLELRLRGEAGRRFLAGTASSPLRLTLGLDLFWTPGEPHTLALLLTGGQAWLRDALICDLFHLGGARGPRGYRAEELPTDSYLGGSLEYRLRLGTSGRLFAFLDGLHHRVPETSWRELAWSYGAGVFVNLLTGGLEVVYALREGAGLGEGVVQARLVFDLGS